MASISYTRQKLMIIKTCYCNHTNGNVTKPKELIVKLHISMIVI